MLHLLVLLDESTRYWKIYFPEKIIYKFVACQNKLSLASLSNEWYLALTNRTTFGFRLWQQWFCMVTRKFLSPFYRADVKLVYTIKSSSFYLGSFWVSSFQLWVLFMRKDGCLFRWIGKWFRVPWIWWCHSPFFYQQGEAVKVMFGMIAWSIIYIHSDFCPLQGGPAVRWQLR